MLCPSCGLERHDYEMHAPDTVPPRIAARIRAENPAWSSAQPVCDTCVNGAIAEDAQALLQTEIGGELSDLEREVLTSLRSGTMLAQNPNITDQPQTMAEFLADSVANTIGTFRFSGLVLLLIMLWLFFGFGMGFLASNPAVLFGGLSAALGTIAAIQNPIILMSQRRAAQRERFRKQNEYRINLKSELEIRYLNAKLDYLLQKLSQEK